MKRIAWFLSWGVALLVSYSSSQTVSIFDTVYTPPGNADGPWAGTMFVPAVSNGIGAVLAHGSGVSRQTIRGWADSLAANGYVAMTVEYPDFLPYPKPARELKLAVQFLRRNAVRFGITTNKIVGVGQSYGSFTWGEAIIWDNDYRFFHTDSTISDHLDAAILLYGIYDWGFSNTDSRAYYGNDSSLFLKGACIKHVGNITTPVFLLHGTGDVVVPVEQSVQLHDSLVARGKASQLVLFPSLPHGFDVFFPAGMLTAAGLIAKDSALAFLRRTVSPGLKIRVSSSTVNFGPLLLSTGDTTSLRVDNIGDGPLTLQSIANGHPDYKLLNLPSLPLAIQPGGSVQFKAAFQPAAQGVVNDTVSVESDDPIHPVVRISLHGKGVTSVASATAGVLYAASPGAPEGYLLHLSTVDGTVDTVGPLGISEIRSMSVRHSDGVIYGAPTTPAPTGVYQINGASGEAALIGRFPIGNLSALAFSRGDTLYGATTTGSLYRIDLASGRTDLLGTSPGLDYSGLSFRPGKDELWASVRYPIDSIFAIDRNNGGATFVGTTGFNALTSSIAFNANGTLYGLIDNGSGENYLASIDTVTAVGSIIAGPLSVSYLRAITMIGGSLAVSERNGLPGATPQKFALFQNYPNPFNPSTMIQYDLPHRSHVTLTVFNTLGQQVAMLVNGEVEAGYHKVDFNASHLASGVYFYRLRARSLDPATGGVGNFVETKRLLLLR